MDYFKQRRAYRNLKERELSISNGQNNLYRELLDYANDESKLDGYFRMKNSALANLTGLSEPGMKKARNELVQLGLIDYRKGRKNVLAPEYKIINLYDKKQSMDTNQPQKFQESIPTGFDKVSQPVTQPVSQPVSHKNLTNTDLDKTSQNPGLAREDVLMDFIEFWDVYPNKMKKVDAQESYYQARLKGVSADEILKGAEAYAGYLAAVVKAGERPPFKANADNWLDQERWTDEYENPEPRESMSADEQKDAQKADSDRELAKRLAALAKAGEQT